MERNDKLVMATGLYFFTLANSVAILIKKRNKRVRRFGIRPMNRKRLEEGLYATLIRDMKTLEYDEMQFFKYTRMTRHQLQYLLSVVGPSLQKSENRNPLSPEHRLIITLHFLAEGCSMQEMAFGYRIGKSTAHKVIKETCQVIWDKLSPTQLPLPTTTDWEAIADGFFKRWNFPNCVGALDGKHITIQAPNNSGSEYFNYKKTFSVVLMATCDAYYRFVLVDIGAPGSNHDSMIFKNSGLGRALFNHELNIPPPKKIPGTSLQLSHVMVADAAFPLHENIMRPYCGRNLGERKNIFNYRISRARRTIENTFGILSQRWRIFRKPIIASLEVCEYLIQAAVVLHNFLQNNEQDLRATEQNDYHTGVENSTSPLNPWHKNISFLNSLKSLKANNSTNVAKKQRLILEEYFVSNQGSLPWQEEYVARGSFPT